MRSYSPILLVGAILLAGARAAWSPVWPARACASPHIACRALLPRLQFDLEDDDDFLDDLEAGVRASPPALPTAPRHRGIALSRSSSRRHQAAVQRAGDSRAAAMASGGATTRRRDDAARGLLEISPRMGASTRSTRG